MTASGSIASAPVIHWTEYGIPIRNLWHMLLYAWNEVPAQSLGTLDESENAPTLDGLLALVLAKLMSQRLRIGLGRSYSSEQHMLRGIRGRINFTESLRHHTFERGQTVSEFQHYSLNVPKNQIVRSTLARLIQIGHFGPDLTQAEELRHRLRRLVRDLDGIDLIELKLDMIRRQQLGRNDRDYRLMLAICELLLQRQMPADMTGSRHLLELDRDELKLYRIYERFVANFYRIHLNGWSVSPQTTLSWHTHTHQPFLPAMRPDLVLKEESSDRIIVLDTKFTTKSLSSNQWGSQGFNSGHLYQMYTYLKTQAHLSTEHRQAIGILLYPATQQPELSERIDLPEQTLRIECVDLTAPWQAIESRLLNIINSAL